jgi:RimJ/RimL family protein N-acetyltransferase
LGPGVRHRAAGALIGFARDTLGLARLVAGLAADNRASARVLTKLGFSLVRETERRSRSRGGVIAALDYAMDLRPPADSRTPRA